MMLKLTDFSMEAHLTFAKSYRVNDLDIAIFIYENILQVGIPYYGQNPVGIIPTIEISIFVQA